ncbi:MAG: methylmalonyl-CoA mutase family protein [Acidimicrobiales bacterium]
MTKAINSGMPKLRIEEAAAKKQARVDRGEDVVVGVNTYVVENPEQVDVLDIDNTAVRESQIARLNSRPLSLVTKRRVMQRWPRFTEAAAGNANLLEACKSTRLRPRHGRRELSDAMEAVLGATPQKPVRFPACTGPPTKMTTTSTTSSLAPRHSPSQRAGDPAFWW